MYGLAVNATACTTSLANMLGMTMWSENLLAAITSDPQDGHGGSKRGCSC